MNDSRSSEKKRPKSKINRNSKKCNPKIEPIRVTSEKKKKCNEKALQIVVEFSEQTVGEGCLLDNLQFINQEYYQDIIEERAINKVCGYPLCSKMLKNIPAKQYHISTTLNKVFDITDRKNFCSNLCYKASKYLKDQIPTSPLWLRENETSATYTLIALSSKGGMTGDEVEMGVSPVKPERDDASPGATAYSDQPSINSELKRCNSASSNNENESLSSKDSTAPENLSDSEEAHKIGRLSYSYSKCDKKDNTNQINASNPRFVSERSCTNDQHELLENSSERLFSQVEPSSSNMSILHKEMQSENLPNTEKASMPSNYSIQNHDDKLQSQNIASKSYKSSTKIMPSSKEINTVNPVQCVVFKIERILREWISINSLCFIVGEEKIKELLAEKKNFNSNGQSLPDFAEDIHFYERYMAICKKLNILELEDTKMDAPFREGVKKPLPDYEALKEEARQMDIKVKMFYKGDKVHFEELEPNTKINSESEVTREPILPLVDVHAQKALRRRIVFDKLRKVVQDLQKSLGLRGFNLSEEMKTLVSTLNLSAHNITMKPAEWNLISIAVIKLLSLRDHILAQALNSNTAHKHLTLLLMSYFLDAGYLDRLMVWLTDIEAVLQKI